MAASSSLLFSKVSNLTFVTCMKLGDLLPLEPPEGGPPSSLESSSIWLNSSLIERVLSPPTTTEVLFKIDLLLLVTALANVPISAPAAPPYGVTSECYIVDSS